MVRSRLTVLGQPPNGGHPTEHRNQDAQLLVGELCPDAPDSRGQITPRGARRFWVCRAMLSDLLVSQPERQILAIGGPVGPDDFLI